MRWSLRPQGLPRKSEGTPRVFVHLRLGVHIGGVLRGIITADKGRPGIDEIARFRGTCTGSSEHPSHFMATSMHVLPMVANRNRLSIETSSKEAMRSTRKSRGKWHCGDFRVHSLQQMRYIYFKMNRKPRKHP